MFESNTTAYTDTKKNVRYESIERRKKSRRTATSDRRNETRAEQEAADRRQEKNKTFFQIRKPGI